MVVVAAGAGAVVVVATLKVGPVLPSITTTDIHFSMTVLLISEMLPCLRQPTPFFTPRSAVWPGKNCPVTDVVCSQHPHISG